MNGELTIHDIRHMTLSQVSTLYGNGSITRETAQDYVDLWNSGPHFTQRYPLFFVLKPCLKPCLNSC